MVNTGQVEITDSEFKEFRSFLYNETGIELSDKKRTLVMTRLAKRLRAYKFNTFSQYFDLIFGHDLKEKQQAIDLLTTNETYFFREPEHFKFLTDTIIGEWNSPRSFRAWSAASSTGEEAYSIGMILADKLANKPWEIQGTDISHTVLNAASNGHYQMNRIDGIPPSYLKRFCLKGRDEFEGSLLVDSKIRQKVRFYSMNLTKPLPETGLFDVIFLRNVMIYFDAKTKEQVVRQLIERIRPGGYFLIGHSESLKGMNVTLKLIKPTIYQKL